MHDRPRPGARRQGRGLRPRRDRQAARQGPDRPATRPTGSRRLVTGSTDKAAFADADFVIEAVFEELEVKQQVFAEVEAVVSPECVLATNTSSLSVTAMAAELEHPERVVGFHFFNPVAVHAAAGDRPGRARPTTPPLATAFAVGKALKKTCVLVKDAPAFVVNRLLTRFLGEVTASVDEGTPVEVADGALDPLGLPMSPFVLLAAGRPGRWRCTSPRPCTRPSRTASRVSRRTCERLVDGRQDRGVYDWSTAGGRRPRGRPRCSPRATPRSPPSRSATGRWTALAEEIRLMLDEGVVAEAAGHRPVHDPRRRLAVPPGRHHAVPGPGRASPSGSPGSASCPAASPRCCN